MDKKLMTMLGLSLALNTAKAEAPTVDEVKAKPAPKKQDEVKQDRAAWEKQLEELAKNPAPEKLRMGAMCYSRFIGRVDNYTCPDCMGTHYVARKGRQLQRLVGDLPLFRKLALEVKELGLPIVLDEKLLCINCARNAKKRFLRWRFTNGEEEIVTEFDTFDCYILKAFAAKKDIVTGPQGRETPLKNYLPRLRELLGLEKETLEEEGGE